MATVQQNCSETPADRILPETLQQPLQQDQHIFLQRFRQQMVFVRATRLCCGSMKAATNNANEQGRQCANVILFTDTES